MLTCLCDYSLFTHYSFHSNKNKHDFHRVEGPIKKFCANVRRQVTETVKCEKKEMIPLAEKQENKYKKQKYCHICNKEFNDMLNEDENYHSV